MFKKKNNYVKKRRQRRYGKKKRGNAPVSVARRQTGNNGSLMPNRLMTKLVYANSRNQTVTTAMNYYKWSVNSLYDPDYSGTGHQPRGFDQLSALYSEYRVHAVKFNVVIVSRSSATVPFYGGIYWHGGTVNPPTTKNGVCESNTAICKHGTSEKPIRISKYFKIAEIFGRSDATVRGDRDFSAGVGADPTIQAIVSVFGQAEDEATSIDLTFNVTIEFYCEFNTFLQPAQS